ncbi:MAG TPA: CBS domain-containing protein [Bacteroidales bacterium]|nr:CBS domain-containing protein [Bacteroidales bacterium]
MTSFTTFYLSRVIGKKVRDSNGSLVGIIKDLFILYSSANNSAGRPLVTGVKLKRGKQHANYAFSRFTIEKCKGKINVTCDELAELPLDEMHEGLWLADAILDKQIVDLNGRKLVRVNDLRLVSIAGGSYVVAVDIGIEGLLRRIGIVKPLKSVFSLFNASVPSKFILWEEVEAIDFSNLNIKLSKSYTKLQTLHPSDLADIIEDLGKKSMHEVFAALDEEKAADVLEELETETQVHIIENLPIEKVADVLEKMPADEVADILDALEDEKAELLLKEMEVDSSQEVRELLEYPENTVGSIMSTEFLSFSKNFTVDDVIRDLRTKKPEAEELYNLFVTNEKEKLIATFSLRDLVISEPNVTVEQIMKPSPIYLHDDQKLDEIAENISKYNLLAIPVVDSEDILQGMVVIDDVVEDLINKRRTNK